MSAWRAATDKTFLPPPPIMIGGRGSLDRCRPSLQRRHRVVLACETERLAREEALQDDRGLLEARDANGCRVEAHAGIVVLLLQPTRAEADLQPALRKHVERCELLRQHRGLSEVLGEHGLCHPQRGGRVRDRLSCDERCEAVARSGQPDRRSSSRALRRVRAESSSLTRFDEAPPVKPKRNGRVTVSSP